MFTWICPKCGAEVPPAYSDCPKCAARSTEPASTAAPPAAAPPSPAEPAPAPPRPASVAPPAPAAAPPAAPVIPPAAPTAAVPPGPPAVRKPLPDWATGALTTLVIGGLLAAFYFWVLPRRSSTAATETGQAPAAAERPAGLMPGAHPLARHLEISGIRLSEQKERSGQMRMQIQYLVVNHSDAELPPLLLQVALRTNKSEDPIAEFPVSLPALGPKESRDASTTVRTNLRVYELPDWQFLRADFDIMERASKR